jgi:hypothetical protein
MMTLRLRCPQTGVPIKAPIPNPTPSPTRVPIPALPVPTSALASLPTPLSTPALTVLAMLIRLAQLPE